MAMTEGAWLSTRLETKGIFWHLGHTPPAAGPLGSGCSGWPFSRTHTSRRLRWIIAFCTMHRTQRAL